MTKLMCTIGPTCNSSENLRELLANGMTLARFSLGHGTFQGHRDAITRLRTAAEDLGRFCAVVVDTRGNSVRSACTGSAVVKVQKGAKLRLKHGNVAHDRSTDSILVLNDAEALKLLKPDDEVRIGFGEIKLAVKSVADGEVLCEALNKGELHGQKTVFLPRGRRPTPSTLTAQDREDIVFAAEVAADFVAASYVTNGEHLREIKAFMREKGLTDAHLIARIDCEEALLNFDDVLEVADAICVSRGNLGEEIDLEAVILAQKLIMRKCNSSGKPVITATQLLESMRVNPSPTRAEASDVGNAVFDGADCVALAGETAEGLYPQESAKMTIMILREAERSVDHDATFELIHGRSLRLGGGLPLREALAASAVKMSFDIDASALVVFSVSGATARLISKYRPKCPVLVVTANSNVARTSLILRGVTPMLIDEDERKDIGTADKALSQAKVLGVKSGHLAVVVIADEGKEDVVEGEYSVKVVTIK